jgi:phosphoserine phosphatase RsbU/P
MKILIADDDLICRSMLEDQLTDWGHEVISVADGTAAWHVLQSADAPSIAVLDWMMPGMDGIAVCQEVRARARSSPPYLILLTSLQEKPSIVTGLKSGADDYVCKPFDPDELHARIDVGIRISELQQKLADRVLELEQALAHVKRLQGILPICSYCKKVRNDQNYWQQVDAYVSEHAEVMFSHGICPECLPQVMRDMGISEATT